MNWISTCLNQKCIPNYTLEECKAIFENKFPFILSDWLLVTVGLRDGVKQMAFLQLVHYTQALRGSHVVRIWSSKSPIQMEVESLSFFRHHVLGYTDHLSFERSTFVVVKGKQCLVRLKCLRSFVFQTHLKKQSVLTYRTKTQFVRNLEEILTSYTRDLHGSYSNEVIKKRMMEDIEDFLAPNEKRMRQSTPSNTT